MLLRYHALRRLELPSKGPRVEPLPARAQDMLRRLKMSAVSSPRSSPSLSPWQCSRPLSRAGGRRLLSLLRVPSLLPPAAARASRPAPQADALHRARVAGPRSRVHCCAGGERGGRDRRVGGGVCSRRLTADLRCLKGAHRRAGGEREGRETREGGRHRLT